VALDDQDGEAWFRLAAAEARIARYDAARRALAEALAEGTTRPGALFLEGWIEEGLGNRPRAIELYQEHLLTFPRDDATRRRLVALLAEAGREKDAYREATLISRSAPRDPDALAVEADLAFKVGRSADANKALSRLADLAPDDPENVRQRIEVLGRNNRAREGVTLARSWSSGHPGDYRGTMLVARARFLAGEKDSALAEARRAVDQAPDSLAPLLLLARMHQQEKRWAEASEVLREVWRRDPARTGVALDIAFCREQIGDLPGAEQAARDALATGPGDPRALNFLGYLLADHNLKLEEAEGLIRKAVEQEPDNGAFVDSMGWVFYRLGRLAEARRELERAVILTGGDAVVREHLGDVYNDMRLIELAKEQYRLCLAGDRSNGRVRSKLDALR
jgi:Flp pilus assembly protein TadD